jgi:YD repeat-containing protein
MSARNLVVIVLERKKNGIVVNLLTARFHARVVRVYDAAGKVIETHDRKGDFKEW